MKAKIVAQELKSMESPKRSEASRWFFKTKKGQYGYGDVFWGVSVPKQRTVAKRHKDLLLPEISLLLESKIHECRLAALFILVGQFKKAGKKKQAEMARFYLSRRKFVNNWDLVDSSAPYILGPYLLDKNRSILYKLARSKNLWDRRIAIISTFAFIKEGQFEDTLKIAEILLKDPRDLIHKAVGWALREVGKKSFEAERRFLDVFYCAMPRTMLRYAIEKFPEKSRQRYLSKSRKQ